MYDVKGNELIEEGLYDGHGIAHQTKKMVIYDFKYNLGDKTKRKTKHWDETADEAFVEAANDNYGNNYED